ncbi:MAG: glycerol-3-phosphate dehydrogenase/oxidase, partial [Pirellulales bacterium]
SMAGGRDRQAIRDRLTNEIFDLVIVGGGINGAGIARDAALRGYRVALIERGDFGCGTSSRSTRLIHGGLRYLEHGQLGLVFESVSERTRLARLARHLVRPLPFVFVSYRGGRSLAAIRFGMWIYDALAMFRNYQRHRALSADRVAQWVPAIRPEGLRGGVLFYDYRTDDARLVLENVLSAVEAGAAALSYASAEAFQRQGGRFTAVEVHDHISGERFAVRGRVAVCAAGPWTDRLLGMTGDGNHWLRPTKGIHAVVPRDRLPLEAALVMRHPRDERVLFAIPYHERTVLGTTDTDFHGDPAEVSATAWDVDYLLEAVGAYFPDRDVTRDAIISTWAGVRPLLDEKGHAEASAVSREHQIDARRDGIVVIAGGKLTTYRLMAAECVDAAAPLVAAAGGPARTPRRVTRRRPLPGAQGITLDRQLEEMARHLGARLGAEDVGRHLAYSYGARAERVAAIADAAAGARRRIDPELPYIWAEVSLAAREEMAVTLADALVRRTQVFYRAGDQGCGVAEQAAAVMGRELGWDAAQQRQQAEAYRNLIAENHRWREPSEVKT